MPADVILIVGSTGAGKTTYARTLAEEIGGVRFSIDEWMTALFWPDSPQPIEFAWTMERIDRCEAQIFELAGQLAARGVPAILDLGFTKLEHRDKFRALAGEAGLKAQVHYVDVPPAERWQRKLAGCWQPVCLHEACFMTIPSASGSRAATPHQSVMNSSPTPT